MSGRTRSWWWPTSSALRAEGITVDYVRLDDPDNSGSFSGELARAVARHRPARVVVTEPGEWRVREMMRDWPAALGVPVEIREDDRFLCSPAEFARWAAGKRELRMEFFYREMRRRHGVLMEGREPAGGQWNYDADNRKGFPAAGPGLVPPPLRFEPDAITREVIALVRERFASHPGRLDSFAWPLTRAS